MAKSCRRRANYDSSFSSAKEEATRSQGTPVVDFRSFQSSSNQRKRVNGPKRFTIETDDILRSLLESIQVDFTDCKLPQCSNRDDLAMLPSPFGAPPWLFKRIVQIRDLWKRYTFSHEESMDLETKANVAFVETQVRVAKPMKLSGSTQMVIRKARTHISRILGPYSFDEHISSCKFSGNATAGSTRSKSYLDCKLTVGLSGTPPQISWFNNQVLSQDGDPSLKKCWNSKYEGPDYIHCDQLGVINVPKSWNKLRSIMPNTTLGSYYSSGLDSIIRSRLKEEGLNLNLLQDKHKRLARMYSKVEYNNHEGRSHVTLDVKTASENFGIDLIRALLPASWWNVFKFGRAKNCKVGDDVIQLSSFMGMGIGFTFTLQTLIFYSLLLAIGDLTGIKGTISVFGDDCIFPKRMYKYVARVFPELRLLINFDKTYAFHDFRESCGGDFYRGYPVRPYMFEGANRKMSGLTLTAELHKLLNGFLSRWERCEIPHTVNLLETLLYWSSGPIMQVPSTAPAYSGILTDSVISSWRYRKPLWDKNIQNWKFACLKEHHDKRRVWLERFYLWNTLRSQDKPETSYSIYDTPACSGLQTRIALPSTKVWSRGENKMVAKVEPMEDRKGSQPRYSDAHLIGFYSECSEYKES